MLHDSGLWIIKITTKPYFLVRYGKTDALRCREFLKNLSSTLLLKASPKFPGMISSFKMNKACS